MKTRNSLIAVMACITLCTQACIFPTSNAESEGTLSSNISSHDGNELSSSIAQETNNVSLSGVWIRDGSDDTFRFNQGKYIYIEADPEHDYQWIEWGDYSIENDSIVILQASNTLNEFCSINTRNNSSSITFRNGIVSIEMNSGLASTFSKISNSTTVPAVGPYGICTSIDTLSDDESEGTLSSNSSSVQAISTECLNQLSGEWDEYVNNELSRQYDIENGEYSLYNNWHFSQDGTIDSAWGTFLVQGDSIFLEESLSREYMGEDVDTYTTENYPHYIKIFECSNGYIKGYLIENDTLFEGRIIEFKRSSETSNVSSQENIPLIYSNIGTFNCLTSDMIQEGNQVYDVSMWGVDSAMIYQEYTDLGEQYVDTDYGVFRNDSLYIYAYNWSDRPVDTLYYTYSMIAEDTLELSIRPINSTTTITVSVDSEDDLVDSEGDGYVEELTESDEVISFKCPKKTPPENN
ncbi:MAG: hypothetical protein OCD01_09970 [Fibrobacterales bacterium]